MEVALINNDIEYVRAVLKKQNASPNQMMYSLQTIVDLSRNNSKSGLALIHLACLVGSPEMLSLLFDEGHGNLICEDSKYRLPLHCVVEGSREDKIDGVQVVVERLLAKNWLQKVLRWKDKRDWTPLHLSFDKPHILAYLLGLVKDGLELEVFQTLLHRIAINGCIESLNVLAGHPDIGTIINGIDVNLGMRTPLLCAAAEGHTDIVEVLLKANADVTSQDSEQQNVLHICYSMEHFQLGDKLREIYPTLATVKDSAGRLPEHWRAKFLSDDIDYVNTNNESGKIQNQDNSHQVVQHAVMPPIAISTLPLESDVQTEATETAIKKDVDNVQTTVNKNLWKHDRKALNSMMNEDAERCWNLGNQVLNFVNEDETLSSAINASMRLLHSSRDNLEKHLDTLEESSRLHDDLQD